MSDSCEGCTHRIGHASSLHHSCYWLAVMPTGDVQSESIWLVEQWAAGGRRGVCPARELSFLVEVE